MLSTLKKNREYVPLEILQTQYRVPYETLKKQIDDTATAFVKEITLSKLMINPDVSLEEQISVIQQTITTSGILKEMGYTLSKLYDVELLHRQALKLRTYIEDALYPYIALQDCLVVDMERKRIRQLSTIQLPKRFMRMGNGVNRIWICMGNY